MSSQVPDVGALLGAAHEEGALSQSAFQSLNVVDVGAQIQAGLGVKVDDVEAAEVHLVAMLIDDSGSIRFGGNSGAVREGHNGVVGALTESKSETAILVHCLYLNGHVLYPYVPLSDVVHMNQGNYNPDGGTPLYDMIVVMLGTVVAKAQEFLDQGVSVRTSTLIVTDGAEMHSTRSDVSDVAEVIKSMHMEEIHMIYAMGIDDKSTDFEAEFKSWGIPDENIMLPDADPSSIRRFFNVFSKSATQGVSASAAGSMGGFGS